MHLGLIAVLLSLLIPKAASADFFFFEPGLGYNRGHYQTDKVQGLGFGLKMGINVSNNVFIGGDAGYHDLQLGAVPTATEVDTGVVIGGDLKAWRVWFTYLMGPTLTIPNGNSKTLLKGAGSKVGLGVKVTGSLYLNFEFRFIDWKESTTDSGTTAVTQFSDVAFLSVSWLL